MYLGTILNSISCEWMPIFPFTEKALCRTIFFERGVPLNFKIQPGVSNRRKYLPVPLEVLYALWPAID
jgi:hypothetical protein